MNCQNVCEQLSAYFDRELDDNATARIRLHLTQCKTCNECLNEYQQLKNLTLSLSEPAFCLSNWEIIARRLDRQAGLSALHSMPRRENRSLIVGALFALAASLLVMLGFFAKKTSMIEGTTQANVASIDFKSLIDLFQKDPTLALSNLSDQFSSEEISIEKAESRFGRPVFAKTLMDSDAQLVSTRMLTFPFCKCPQGQCTCRSGGCECVACVCQRPDGSTYLVLEHCNAQGVTFGDLPVQIVNRGNHQLQQVTVDGLKTVSWEGNGGRLTAIGLKSEHEIDTLLARDRKSVV